MNSITRFNNIETFSNQSLNKSNSVNHYISKASLQADTISFSGAKTEKAKGGLFSSLKSIFASKETDKPVEEKPISKVWYEDSAVTPEDSKSELAETLRAMTHEVQGRDYDYIQKLYSEYAIKNIVKYSKTNPELAVKLSELYKGSFQVSPETIDIITEKQQSEPELVSKIFARSFSIENAAYYLKAMNINPDFTNRILDGVDCNKASEYVGSYSLITLAKAVDEYGLDLVSKYALEPNIPIYPFEAIELCKLDSEHNETIAELIDFVSTLEEKDPNKHISIPEILSIYEKEPETVKALLLGGFTHYSQINSLIEPYKSMPEELSLLFAKRKEDKHYYYHTSPEEFVRNATKLREYAPQFEQMAGCSPSDLSFRKIVEIIGAIDKANEEIHRITNRSY